MRAWLAGTVALFGGLLTALPLAAAEIYAAGSSADPAVRAATFLGEDRRHYSAAAELLRLPAARGGDTPPSALAKTLADNYLGFGVRDRAERLYRQIAGSGLEPEVLARAGLRVASFDYQRGYYSEARATLMRLRGSLPESLIPEWQDLLARVLMSQGRYSEAVEVLTELKNSRDQSDYSRYNLGIALINDGRTGQGRTALDRIGRGPVVDAETLALRDKANLILGWNFLQNRQGASARPVFGRVRSEGPFSNRALLGLGWAELSPDGSRQARLEIGDEVSEDIAPFSTFSTLGVLLRPGFLDRDIYNRAGLRSFRLQRTDPDEEAALKRALVAWVELISRDPQDPAVQEAWLAIPFSLDRLGAHTQAQQYYEQAVEKLEAARERTEQALLAIAGGRMVETIVRRDPDAESGWTWSLRDLPDAPETYYLQTLIAEHRFAEALKNYRDARLLARQLQGWQQRLGELDAAYRSRDAQPADPARLIDHALQRGRPAPVKGAALSLRAESRLGLPGRHARRPAETAPMPLTLQLAGTPRRFDGPFERIQALRARSAGLLPAVEASATEHRALLERLASEELRAQKKQIEKYLVEARFALARLYDRQLQGPDPDEFEIKK
ncbi:MAG TPA: hypothetical protein VFV27_11890 [Nevskiaceae bacterium]|nr:hypothetical protein [Nevskiaceae bacterium]